ncbi:hypothetical protein L1987_83131 [Smallanthus sonchifolius]|uniref:Uncharacterized protein n=1 Tax=Smallanthus sonchifolius TaxID=185202 RepID=A0ACB8YBQ6_9ASTR|nr:hypothetical protein L1987_83131 [Smallanthus sonchifolius]
MIQEERTIWLHCCGIPLQVVIFRDGTCLTLKQVFDNLDLTRTSCQIALILSYGSFLLSSTCDSILVVLLYQRSHWRHAGFG